MPLCARKEGGKRRNDTRMHRWPSDAEAKGKGRGKGLSSTSVKKEKKKGSLPPAAAPARNHKKKNTKFFAFIRGGDRIR